MTDRDDRQSDDRPQSSKPASDDAVSVALRVGEAPAHHDRTDPEVPNAKRKGARQRRGTLVALSALVVSLLTIALSLLYRASEKVSETANGRLAAAMQRIANPDSTAVKAEAFLSVNGRDQEEHPHDQLPRTIEKKDNGLPLSNGAIDAGHEPPAATSSQSKGDPANGIIRAPAF